MIGLEITFLGGRFHGNPWHHAHNEAIPEWPPSPWRILRTLLAAACRQGARREEAVALLERLRDPPHYRLPRAVEAHTRHYMPDTSDASHKRSKVFDAFVAVEGGAESPAPLLVAWPTHLEPAQRQLLERACEGVDYLGRSESWASLRVVDVEGDQWDCWPDGQREDLDFTSLLAVAPARDLEEWSASRPRPKAGRDVPRDLWDVLTFEGRRYRSEGWNMVPGTRLVRYVFARRPFRRAPIPRGAAHPRTSAPTVARYAIRSAVLPRLREAISIGERLKQAVMSHAGFDGQLPSPTLSGHDLGGGAHLHAMYLPSADTPKARQRGEIDHLTIVARGGFSMEDRLALESVRRLWGKGGHDLELVLVGLGTEKDLGGDQAPWSPLVASSTVWESLTPFVPTRHPKLPRGVDGDAKLEAMEAWMKDQIGTACERLLGVRPALVEAVGDRARWARFRRRRFLGDGRRGVDWPVGARLHFDAPVQGPIALGYGAHFGLGLFVPAR